MSGYLLDVNVLIALLDPVHIHHERAHVWFAHRGEERWCTVPLTENGVIRIVSNPQYSNSQPVQAIAESLRSLFAVEGHCAEHDTVSLLDADVDISRLTSSAQVTDTYLIAQAAALDARLATFDRRITSAALPYAGQVVYQIP